MRDASSGGHVVDYAVTIATCMKHPVPYALAVTSHFSLAVPLSNEI
jgi:hypothetical protein